jgi:PadR family transcriptional regulator
MSATGRPGARRGPSMPFQPANFLRPCLLLLVDERPGYGYDLRERLRLLGAGEWDSGTVYRLLNNLEDEGLVRSWWEESADGPQRRCYRLTDGGQTALDEWARQLEDVWRTLQTFLERYARQSPGCVRTAATEVG